MRTHIWFYPQTDYLNQIYQKQDREMIEELFLDDDYMSFNLSCKEKLIQLIEDQFNYLGYKQFSGWLPTITNYETLVPGTDFSEVQIHEHEVDDKSVFTVRVFFVYDGAEQAEKYIDFICAIGKELNAYLLVSGGVFTKPEHNEVSELLRKMKIDFPRKLQ